MFDRQAQSRDVGPVHNQAIGGSVHGPPEGSSVSVVRAPYPGVVDNHIVAIDFEAFCSGSRRGAANAEEDIVDRGRVAGVANARVRARNTYLQEDRRVDRTGIDEQSGNLDSVDVGNRNRGRPILRDDVRVAKS